MAMQRYEEFVDTRSSSSCVDLAEFDSDSAGTAGSSSPVSGVVAETLADKLSTQESSEVVDRESGESSGEAEWPGEVTISRFSPLHRPVLDGVTGSFGSVMGSPATSLSITEQSEHQPLIPLPVVEMSEANHE